MKRKNILKFLIIALVAIFLTGCSCGCSCQTHYKSSSECQSAFDEIISVTDTDVETRKTQTINKLIAKLNTERSSFINTYIEGSVDTTFNTDSLNNETIENAANAASILLNTELNQLKNSNTLKSSVEYDVDTYILNRCEEVKNITLLTYLKDTALNLVSTIVDDESYEDYQIILFEADQAEAIEKLNNINDEITASDYAESSYDTYLLTKAKEIEQIVLDCQTSIVTDTQQPEPIRFQLNSVGDFFSNFFDNFFIYPVGWLLHIFTKLCGNLYVVGLLITTLLIRTIAWPIYAKSNDMTLKMKLMEPEQAKIQEKYARRQDKESQQMMQMELMQLYKKYGVGVGGCLMPFLQLPIFLAVFRAVSRLPYTNGTVGSPDWVEGINSYIFGIDLFADKSAGTGQFIGIIILCVLVGVTQILQQVIMNKRNKKAQEDSQANIPAYRRQAVAQSQQNNSMKIFMWVMVAMMVVFVFQSKAGLGIYWLIGNLYALFQSYIGSKTSAKRLEKLRQKSNRR